MGERVPEAGAIMEGAALYTPEWQTGSYLM